MKSQGGFGLIEFSMALLLVSLASVGLARSQLLVLEFGEQARRHAAAVRDSSKVSKISNHC